MERTSTASTKAALCLLAALFALSVYRAATCDVTPGEAWNYDRYISPTWQESLRQFDVNNHVLNTFLVRISTAAFGRKEIALRLPSLLAGIFFYWAIWRLGRRILGMGWGFTAAIALLTLNPLIVDALSEARGYGMAMAAWLWALDRVILYLEDFESRKLNQAALYMALSVAACLSFIVPVLGLALTTVLLSRRLLARDLWFPMLVFLFVLLAIPLNRALLSDFAQGATSLRQTLAELTTASLGALRFNATSLSVIRILVALLLVAGVVASVSSSIRRGKPEPVLALCAGTALIGFLILLAAHAKIKTPFPQRGAVYFIPILTLLGLALLRRAPAAMLALSTICVLIYAAAFPTGAYLDGREFVAPANRVATSHDVLSLGLTLLFD